MLLLCKQHNRRLRLNVAVVKSLVDQLITLTAQITPRILVGCSKSYRVRVAGMQGSGSEDNTSVELFVVESCSRSCDKARHLLQVTSSNLGNCCC